MADAEGRNGGRDRRKRGRDMGPTKDTTEWIIVKIDNFWYAMNTTRPGVSDAGPTWESVWDYVCGRYRKPTKWGTRRMRRRSGI